MDAVSCRLKTRRPPLADLHAFEAAARHLSFTRAAAELGVTQGAVSQRIRRLEDTLGRPLFERLTRALALTADGKTLAAAIGDGLARIDDGLAAIDRQRRPPRGAATLTLSVAPGFAGRWLLPRLGRFRERHPDIEVRIEAEDRLANFAGDGVDLAIRCGLGAYPGLQLRIAHGRRRLSRMQRRRGRARPAAGAAGGSARPCAPARYPHRAGWRRLHLAGLVQERRPQGATARRTALQQRAPGDRGGHQRTGHRPRAGHARERRSRRRPARAAAAPCHAGAILLLSRAQPQGGRRFPSRRLRRMAARRGCGLACDGLPTAPACPAPPISAAHPSPQKSSFVGRRPQSPIKRSERRHRPVCQDPICSPAICKPDLVLRNRCGSIQSLAI